MRLTKLALVPICLGFISACGAEPASQGDLGPDPEESGVDDVSPPDSDGKADAAASRYTIDFYPKLTTWDGRTSESGVIVVSASGTRIFAGYARGGPLTAQGTQSKTPSGTYHVAGVGPKLSSNRWPMSIVQWGSTLTVVQNAAGRVTGLNEHYTDLAGKQGVRPIDAWKLTAVNSRDFDGPVGLIFQDTDQDGVIEASEQTADNLEFAGYVASGAPIFTNDFGHIAADLGANGVFIHPVTDMYDDAGNRLEECSTLSGDCELPDSHGCIHVSPALVDHLIGHGWLRKGTKVVVHGYNETAPAQAQTLLGQLAALDASPEVTERDPNCGCDVKRNVCDAAITGTKLVCQCDVDCN